MSPKDKTFIVHVFPSDVVTEKDRKWWRRLVRKRMKEGIMPPTLNIETPPQKVETQEFLKKPATGIGFLITDKASSEEEKKDDREEFEW